MNPDQYARAEVVAIASIDSCPIFFMIPFQVRSLKANVQALVHFEGICLTAAYERPLPYMAEIAKCRSLDPP